MPPEDRFAPVLLAAQTGEEWALAALYRDFHPALLRYLRAQERDEAEDLSSDVWVDAAVGLNRFRGDESAFRSWLFTIARRRLIDLRRRRGRRRTEPLPPELAELAAPASDEPAGDDALALLSALPPEQAEVVVLRVVAGLDSNQVAAVMGKKAGTVRVLQHRGLERLAELLSAERRTSVTR